MNVDKCLLKLNVLFNEYYHSVYKNSYHHRWICERCEKFKDVFGCPCIQYVKDDTKDDTKDTRLEDDFIDQNNRYIEIGKCLSFKLEKIFAHAPPSWWTILIAEEAESPESDILHLFKICFPDNTPREILTIFSEIEEYEKLALKLCVPEISCFSLIFNKFTKNRRPLVFIDLFKDHLQKKTATTPIDSYATLLEALHSREFYWWFRLDYT